MSRLLRILNIEDSERDVALLQRLLSRADYEVISARVETPAEMKSKLETEEWDIILCDYTMPRFSALAALELLKRTGLDIPFIIVSGSIGEESAVSAMLAGANDYLMKDNLARLVPAIERELAEAKNRRDRRRAEESLKEAEEKYRNIFENAIEGIFQISAEGKFIAVNPAMSDMLGYNSPEELIELRTNIETERFVDPESRVKLEKLLEKNSVVTGFECDIYRKDRSKIRAIINIRAVRDKVGALLYFEGSIQDITERKQLEEQFRQSQKLEAIGQLAGGIAHDFNNMLTAITGYSELALRQLQAGDPLRQNIDEIRKAGERAAELTRQLLAFSRKQILQPKVLDLNRVILEIEKMLQRLISEDIELHAELQPELGSVKADPGQIEQVIMNLVVNARDAMPGGGKLIIETQNVYLDEEYASRHIGVAAGHYIMLAVSDTGTGIDAETKKHLFEPFFTTKELGKGTGLGLSTVYGIVKQSGGSVWVYSEVGRGTSFKVYLPCIDEDAEEYRQRAEIEQNLEGTETVLLAEDEEIVRKLTREVLETYGYRVLEAPNGGSGLLICERYEETIHLLMSDVVMPEMSGRELADRLLRLRPEMKVLFMSGYTDNAIMDHVILDKEINFIQKPFSPEALARKVRTILDSSARSPRI